MPSTGRPAGKAQASPGRDSDPVREWDAWAETYDDTAGLFAWINDSLILRTVAPGGKKVLDVGCGSGRLSRLLATEAREVVGIDVSPEMVKRARRDVPANARFLEMSLFDLPADETYDAIVVSSLLHHFDAKPMLASLKGALAAGGLLLMIEPIAGGHLDRLRYFDAARRAFGLRFVLKLFHARFASGPWRRHSRDERLPTFREFKDATLADLPGAEVRRVNNLFGMITWRKPN